jgi:two-component system cell cycle sensor histidine kinase PleC
MTVDGLRSPQQRVEFKAHQPDIERRLAELTAAKDQAESANRAKTAFIAMVCHELRTPLTTILGFSELARTLAASQPAMPQTMSTYTNRIHEAAAHLSGLVNRMLDLAKIDSGRMEITLEALDVAESVQAVLLMVSERAAICDINLEMTIMAGAETIWADDQMLMQMLLNLMSNAIRFTSIGGWISVSARATEDGGVALAVTDTGCGIPADKLEAVLSPFEQIDNHYRCGMNSTGLGLALVRGMIRLHRGRITIASPPDAGTRVTLYFPPPTNTRADRKEAASPRTMNRLGNQTTAGRPPNQPDRSSL